MTTPRSAGRRRAAPAWRTASRLQGSPHDVGAGPRGGRKRTHVTFNPRALGHLDVNDCFAGRGLALLAPVTDFPVRSPRGHNGSRGAFRAARGAT
jgi:hypothetical protein